MRRRGSLGVARRSADSIRIASPEFLEKAVSIGGFGKY